MLIFYLLSSSSLLLVLRNFGTVVYFFLLLFTTYVCSLSMRQYAFRYPSPSLCSTFFSVLCFLFYIHLLDNFLAPFFFYHSLLHHSTNLSLFITFLHRCLTFILLSLSLSQYGSQTLVHHFIFNTRLFLFILFSSYLLFQYFPHIRLFLVSPNVSLEHSSLSLAPIFSFSHFPASPRQYISRTHLTAPSTASTCVLDISPQSFS